MGSTVSAVLATAFKVQGMSFSISSACSTGAHCIGTGYEQILLNKADMAFCRAGENVYWDFTSMFDCMGALSTSYNDTPKKASRAFDKSRDGFCIAGGGGVVILEELEHAKARGAKIYAELVGYGANSDIVGHALGAAGVHETIYTILMMNNNFMAKSKHQGARGRGGGCTTLIRG